MASQSATGNEPKRPYHLSTGEKEPPSSAFHLVNAKVLFPCMERLCSGFRGAIVTEVEGRPIVFPNSAAMGD